VKQTSENSSKFGKIVTLHMHITENCWRKDQAWVHFVPNQ